MTFKRDNLIDAEIETSAELARSGKPIATPTKRGFGELKPPLVWSAKSKLPQIWDGPVPSEPYVDVCQYVRPSQRWVRRE
jgi:hypothetical protein